jgi:hypothetical protein
MERIIREWGDMRSLGLHFLGDFGLLGQRTVFLSHMVLPAPAHIDVVKPYLRDFSPVSGDPGRRIHFFEDAFAKAAQH